MHRIQAVNRNAENVTEEDGANVQELRMLQGRKVEGSSDGSMLAVVIQIRHAAGDQRLTCCSLAATNAQGQGAAKRTPSRITWQRKVLFSAAEAFSLRGIILLSKI